MSTPVVKAGRSRDQGVDGLLSEKDCVTGGLGELLDTGGDVQEYRRTRRYYRNQVEED